MSSQEVVMRRLKTDLAEREVALLSSQQAAGIRQAQLESAQATVSALKQTVDTLQSQLQSQESLRENHQIMTSELASKTEAMELQHTQFQASERVAREAAAKT